MDESAKKGFYTLVQFRPIPEREEGVNIGVCLFELNKGLITARGPEGVGENFFIEISHILTRLPYASIDKERFIMSWNSLIKHISKFCVPEEIKTFIAHDSGDLVLLQPRYTIFENPELKVNQLFELLVAIPK